MPKGTASTRVYKASGKHCEPITAEKPGLKCPRWSKDIAQELLDESEPWGEKRIATRDGVAFVAQDTRDGTWHGYPEAWDNIDQSIKMRWKREGKIKKKHLRRYGTQEELRDIFGGSLP